MTVFASTPPRWTFDQQEAGRSKVRGQPVRFRNGKVGHTKRDVLNSPSPFKRDAWVQSLGGARLQPTQPKGSTMTITFTVPARNLSAAIKAVTPLAAPPASEAPVLGYVQFRVTADGLTLLATDRYVAGMAFVQLIAGSDDDATFLLRATDMKAVKIPTGVTSVAFTVHGDDTVGLAYGDGTSLMFVQGNDAYPEVVSGIIRDATYPSNPEVGESAPLDVARLVQFAACAKAYKSLDKHLRCVARPGKKASSVIVEGHFAGAIMPLQMEREAVAPVWLA